jgi:3-oxoadipate enol-lactonase
MIGIERLQSGMVQLEGTNLYFELAGHGTPLVLGHAGFVDSRMWDEQFQAFAQHYRTLRYDRRGFGRSDPANGNFSHRQDLSALMNTLGLEAAHLVGSSMGGAVMIDFALEYPEKAKSLVLVSSDLNGLQPQGEPPKPLQDLMAALAANDQDRAAALAVDIWVAGPRRKAEEVSSQVRLSAQEMALTALKNVTVEDEPLVPPAVQRLGELRLPTLVVVGELDDVSIHETGRRLTAGIVSAREITVSGTAHMLNMEKPALFNHQVLEFLKSTAA